MHSSSFILAVLAAGTAWNQHRPGLVEFLYEFCNGAGGPLVLFFLLVIAMALGWHYTGRYRRAERRRRQIESPRTKCFSCGYDLRSTRNRCPECGMPVTVRPTSSHVALTPDQKAPRVERDFYLKSDGTLWAIELAGGLPVKAMGPLPATVMDQGAQSLDFIDAENAVEWNMADFVRAREVDRLKLIRDIAGRDRPRK